MRTLNFLLTAACAAIIASASGCAEDRDIFVSPPERAAGSITVGIVDMETLFRAYAGAGEFYAKAEDLQSRFEDLGEDDFEDLMRLQMEFQAMQMQFFRGFQEDVGKTAKSVSELMGLDLVAVEILHSSPETEIVDVTRNFMNTDLFSEGPGFHIHGEFCGPDCE